MANGDGELRTFSTFSIRYTNNDGSHTTISGYDTRAECERQIAFATKYRAAGEIIEKTWQAVVPPWRIAQLEAEAAR